MGFIVFMLFMYKLLYKPYFDMTDKRKEEVEKNLDEAERLRIEAQDLKEKNEKELSEAKNKKDEIIKNAEENAKNISKKAKEDADKEKKRIISSAEREAEELKEKAMKDVQAKVVQMALSVSSMILKEKIDRKTNEELVSRALKTLNNQGDNL
ncbi:MAG: F0F1 ATP synthase subunit B [Thermotogota bacterium]